MADDFMDFVKFDGFAGQAWYHQMIRDKRILRRAREFFTPERLFKSGEQGVWYDPSDLSTLFQDAAGTIPVTGTGQPVGLMLDKSRGLVLGPDTVQEDYFTNATGWTLGAGWALSGNSVVFSGSASNSTAAKTTATPAASVFVELRYTVSGHSGAGSIGVDQGRLYTGPNGTGALIDTRVAGNGTYVFRGYWLFGSVLYLGRPGSALTLSGLSIRKLPGNHASQPTASKRPILQESGGLYSLKFDGVDDFMSTAAIDFSGTDKLSAWCGAAKAQESAFKVLINLAGDVNVTAGSFDIGLPLAIGHPARFATNAGSFSSVISTTTPGGSAPAVIECSYDLSGSTRTQTFNPKINGIAPALTNGGADDPGTGNFANAPLYIGARAGTAAFFNGNLYQLVIAGALYDADTVAKMNAWTAKKTGVTI